MISGSVERVSARSGVELPATTQPAIVAYRRIVRRRRVLTVALLVAIVVAVLFDISTGPAGMSMRELLGTLFHPERATAASRVVVWEFRLPTALMAVLVGICLGLGGGEMQTVLDNPLASPFTLGISAAAAFGAALSITFNWQLPALPSGSTVSVCACLSALVSVLILERVARWRGGSTLGVILFGIALVYSFQALIMLLQFVATEEALQGIVFWTMGSLARANWWTVGLLALAVLIVAPHIARMLLGEDHRYYLPGSAMAGALIISLASIASKSILPGALIPVGIVTSLVGIPLFLTIAVRRLRRE